MDSFRHDFYVQPMANVYWEMAATYLLWTLGMFALRGKARRVTAAVFFLLACGVVALFTIWGRGGNGTRVLSLTPFITFQHAKMQPELYRAMFMNVFLFLPFGLSLPYALPARLQRSAAVAAAITVAAGLLLSIAVEAIQFRFALGNCETDDVLMNTLGAAIGATSFLLHRAVSRLIKRMKHS